MKRRLDSGPRGIGARLGDAPSSLTGPGPATSCCGFGRKVRRASVLACIGVLFTAAVAGCGSSSSSPPSDPKGLTLALADLPTGFTVTKAKPERKPTNDATQLIKHGWVHGYERDFLRKKLTGLIAVNASAASFHTASDAQWGFGNATKKAKAQLSKGTYSLSKMSSPNLGDESAAYAVSGKSGTTSISGEAILIRKGRYDGAVIGVGLAGLNDATTIVPLAKREATLLAKGK